MPINTQKLAYFLLTVLMPVTFLIIYQKMPSESERQAYHQFSDTCQHLYVPHFWNVISNLPFLIVGALGLIRLNKLTIPPQKIQYFIFFLGVALVSFGSAYYHWKPNEETLVWDRLPMTIGFMSLVSIIISEFIDRKWGYRLLIPLVALGFLSIVFWVVYDNLLFYGFVQFYPILAVPIVLIFFRSNSRYSQNSGYWLLLFSYLLAKVCEKYDIQIHDNLHFISGHSLKHIFAALGIWFLYKNYSSRKKAY